MMLAHQRGYQHRGIRTLRFHVRALPFVGAPEDALRQIAAIAPRPACRDDRAQRPFRVRRDGDNKARFLIFVKRNLLVLTEIR
jgi:hypothetical protein